MAAAKDVRLDSTIAGNIEHKEIAACTYDHGRQRSTAAAAVMMAAAVVAAALASLRLRPPSSQSTGLKA
jgi:hypothetical protein